MSLSDGSMTRSNVACRAPSCAPTDDGLRSNGVLP